MSVPEPNNLVDEEKKILEKLLKEEEEVEKQLEKREISLKIKQVAQSLAEKKSKLEDKNNDAGCDSGATGGGTSDGSGPSVTTNDGDEFDKIIAEASKENERLDMELKKQKAAQILQAVNEKKRKLQPDDDGGTGGARARSYDGGDDGGARARSYDGGDDGGARARGGAPVQGKCHYCRVTNHTTLQCTHRTFYCIYCRKTGHHIENCMRKKDGAIPEQTSVKNDEIMRVVKLNNELLFMIHKELHEMKKQQ